MILFEKVKSLDVYKSYKTMQLDYEAQDSTKLNRTDTKV